MTGYGFNISGLRRWVQERTMYCTGLSAGTHCRAELPARFPWVTPKSTSRWCLAGGVARQAVQFRSDAGSAGIAGEIHGLRAPGRRQSAATVGHPLAPTRRERIRRTTVEVAPCQECPVLAQQVPKRPTQLELPALPQRQQGASLQRQREEGLRSPRWLTACRKATQVEKKVIETEESV